MTKQKTIEVIVLRETALQSLISDAGTFATIAGLIGLGWFLGSNAMQWAGFVMAFLTILASAKRKGSKRLTIEQARKRLDELETPDDH